MTMQTLTIVATAQARPGKEAALRAALTGLLAPTRMEAGCINYDMHISPEDPSSFLFYETWAGQAEFDAHMKSPHMKALLPRLDELCLAFPQITPWKKLD